MFLFTFDSSKTKVTYHSRGLFCKKLYLTFRIFLYYKINKIYGEGFLVELIVLLEFVVLILLTIQTYVIFKRLGPYYQVHKLWYLLLNSIIWLTLDHWLGNKLFSLSDYEILSLCLLLPLVQFEALEQSDLLESPSFHIESCIFKP